MKSVYRTAVLAAALTAILASVPRSGHAVEPHLAWWNSEALDQGFGGGIKHRIRVLVLSVDGRVGYVRFADVNVNAIPLEVTAQVDLGLLYAGGGVGYYLLDHGWDNQPGASVLLGASLGLGGLGVFGEALYTWVDAKQSKVDVGSVSGMRLNLGVTF